MAQPPTQLPDRSRRYDVDPAFVRALIGILDESQGTAGLITGVSRAQVSNWALGKQSPELPEIDALVRAVAERMRISEQDVWAIRYALSSKRMFAYGENVTTPETGYHQLRFWPRPISD